MNCKVILRVYLGHMYLQSLIETPYLIYVNNIKNNLAIGYWVDNLERFHNNEYGE